MALMAYDCLASALRKDYSTVFPRAIPLSPRDGPRAVQQGYSGGGILALRG